MINVMKYNLFQFTNVYKPDDNPIGSKHVEILKNYFYIKMFVFRCISLLIYET
jgi:hypothetical protein